ADISFLAEAPAVRAAAQGISDPVKLAGSWVEQYGLGLAVITLGPGGGVTVEPGGKTTRVPGYPTKVIDTVGAGDTFMAGFLDARIRLGQDLESSLHRAAAAASINCSRQGAQPPTSAEVDELIADAADG
ncbi:MAG TPA: PfkB family carbohydrate kinase, partial [Propionibacteriaceae bacterium]|nr:PfkB family carbohydrate kinase [Propionibacteriaceae bacterium]